MDELSEKALARVLQDAADAFGPPQGLQHEMEARLMAKIEYEGPLGQALHTPAIRKVWNMATLLKLAAVVAVVVGIAGAVVLLKPGGQIALADVAQSMAEARTASFTLHIGGPGVPEQNFDSLFLAPMKMRQTSTDGMSVVISDLKQGKILTITPSRQQATLIEMTGMPEEPGTLNLFEHIRQRVMNALQSPDPSVTPLGETTVEGRDAVGFRIQCPDCTITVWADVHSSYPVRVELVEGNATYTVSQVKLNVPVDESLFSLVPPQGYAVQTIQNDMSPPREQDLLNLLAVWTADMDGEFPPVLERHIIQQFMSRQKEKIKAAGQEPSEQDVRELQEKIMRMTRGGMFVANLPKESNWYYAGKGLKIDDGQTAVCWYQPAGATCYRVVYDDLSVRKVPADQVRALQVAVPR